MKVTLAVLALIGCYQPAFIVDHTLTEQCRWDYRQTEGDFGGQWSVCDPENINECYCWEDIPSDEEFEQFLYELKHKLEEIEYQNEEIPELESKLPVFKGYKTEPERERIVRGYSIEIFKPAKSKVVHSVDAWKNGE